VTEGGTTTAVAVRPGGDVRRAIAVAVLGLGVAAGAAAITILAMLLRAVTALGGSCAVGEASLAAAPCRSHTETALLLVFACALACLLAVNWAAGVLRAPRPLLLAWSALCLTLGWSFLRNGFDPPMGEHLALGYVVGGAVFLLLGAGPLLVRIPAGRGERR
jgi:hypothetical protein